MNQVIVFFEGLGLPRMTLNKVAFTLFGRLEVRWYGILITLGIVLAFLYAFWRGRQEGVTLDDITDVGLATVLCGVIGARLYYVLTSLDQFPDLKSVFTIWNGGLGIYGGIIGGCIGILIVCAVKKLRWRRLFDMIAPGVMIAQALGRWGNFFNGEAYGYPIGETTRYFFFTKEFELNSGEGTFFNLFRMGLYPNEYSATSMVFVHPTFLYESVWNILGFVLINLFYKRKKFDGQVALMYFTWYGFGRMFIEGLRTDSLYIFKGLISEDGLRISQLVGLICFAVGLILLIVFGVRNRGNKPGFVIATRELPVRRMTATGEIVVEQPASVQASSGPDGEGDRFAADGEPDSGETPAAAQGNNGGADRVPHANSASPAGSTARPADSAAERPAERVGKGDRFAADCEPDSDETPTAEPDREDVPSGSAFAPDISTEKETPSNGNKN